MSTRLLLNVSASVQGLLGCSSFRPYKVDQEITAEWRLLARCALTVARAGSHEINVLALAMLGVRRPGREFFRIHSKDDSPSMHAFTVDGEDLSVSRLRDR